MPRVAPRLINHTATTSTSSATPNTSAARTRKLTRPTDRQRDTRTQMRTCDSTGRPRCQRRLVVAVVGRVVALRADARQKPAGLRTQRRPHRLDGRHGDGRRRSRRFGDRQRAVGALATTTMNATTTTTTTTLFRFVGCQTICANLVLLVALALVGPNAVAVARAAVQQIAVEVAARCARPPVRQPNARARRMRGANRAH